MNEIERSFENSRKNIWQRLEHYLVHYLIPKEHAIAPHQP